MKSFKEFINDKIIKKQNPKPARAKDLLNETAKRYAFLKTIQDKEEFANYLTENAYDVIRELIEAKLYLDGYKSGSHEATISYLKEIGYSDTDVIFLDTVRNVRNGIKYYGEISSLNFSHQVLDFLEKIYQELRQKVESDLKKLD
jgi:hypothetical protein